MLHRIKSAVVIVPLLVSGAAAAQPAPAPMPTAASAWTVPDPDKLPDDAFGRSVREGRDLIVKTSSLIGPDARDPARHYSGNGLDCQSCHLNAGTQQFGLPLIGVWGVFPTYIARENAVSTLEDRINGCMERSMNGKALPPGSPEMKAMLSYIRFISAPEKTGQSLVGRATPPLKLQDKAGDPVHGQQVFTATCAICHGANGQGQRLDPAEAKETGRRYRFPPLWGRTASMTAPAWIEGSPPPGLSTPTCRSAPRSKRPCCRHLTRST